MKKPKKHRHRYELRPCPIHKNYFVDSEGNVYRKMNPGIGNHGYKRIMISVNGKRKYVSVHRLMLEAFIGLSPNSVTRHLNGNPLDNRIENLSYGTMAENNADTALHGKRLKREKHPMAKLDLNKVSAVRKLYNSGISISELSRNFGVSHACISDIIKGRTWKP